MKIDLTLGCSLCGYKHEAIAELPFNCDDYMCPKCKSYNSLSIISVKDDSNLQDVHASMLNDLFKLRRM